MRKKVIPIRCSPVTELECGEDRVAKGYVPVVVGVGKELRRFVVSVRAFKHPCFVGLLEMAAQEFGFQQKGVLRIPCDAQHFEQVFRLISISV
ncbi:Auxin responsive protein [Musa troglodytarum]|uniref:Auxin responsive protein n=1 Tax=Musa troglodytarum TaxID=320322 RepID=A0A9E7FR41_9LILI|nr:Auxin responsive protein [Musa troglodytarum]